jgi:hypothetical protein
VPGNLPDEAYDQPMGVGTGAGVIFGNTGGVMEAAVGGPAGGEGGPPPAAARPAPHALTPTAVA